MKEIQQLFLQWFRAYPGLWLSPLGLILLGGWMWLQPAGLTQSGDLIQPSNATEAVVGATEAAGSIPPLDTGATGGLAGILVTNANDFDAGAPSVYQERPTQKAGAGTSDPAKPGATSTGKTDAELAAGPGAMGSDKLPASASSKASPDPTPKSPSPGPQDIAAAKAAAKKQQQELAAAAAKAKAPAPAPAPNVINGGNPAVDQAIIMQVAIAQGDANLSMGVTQAGVIFTPQGQALAQLPAGQHSLSCQGQNLVLNGQESFPGTVMMAPGAGGLNLVRDRNYRGQMQFFCQGNTVLAVNHIDLLHYLYSVVGSEVSPSWPIASLKAQAVAARSYGLTYYFRPATEHFHIGDSESYQVYKGTETEDSRVMQAVHETAGEFISYDGGIVESLYAASDEIVMDAFQGGGMSQTGARDLSQQGYNYLQILGYYYPKTSLGRLALDTGS